MRISQKAVVRTSLALFLLVPFILREVYSRAEPYPAVLLPSGAGRIYVGTGEVNCGNLELLAVLSSGEERRIDPSRFFAPIPTHFWPYIAVHNRFGFGPEERRNVSIGMWRVSVTSKRESNAAEKGETISWIRGRLERFDIRDAVAIRIRRVRFNYDIKERVELNKTTVWEFDVELAD